MAEVQRGHVHPSHHPADDSSDSRNLTCTGSYMKSMNADRRSGCSRFVTVHGGTDFREISEYKRVLGTNPMDHAMTSSLPVIECLAVLEQESEYRSREVHVF